MFQTVLTVTLFQIFGFRGHSNSLLFLATFKNLTSASTHPARSLRTRTVFFQNLFRPSHFVDPIPPQHPSVRPSIHDTNVLLPSPFVSLLPFVNTFHPAVIRVASLPSVTPIKLPQSFPIRVGITFVHMSKTWTEFCETFSISSGSLISAKI